jgi:hypothetical protein
MFHYGVTKMEKNNLEQGYATKLFVKLGEGATNTYEKIQKAIGNNSISRVEVFRWQKEFGNRRERVELHRNLEAPPL